jgi:predicted Zn-dependent protease
MLAAAMVAISPLASAYYYFVYFAGRTGPFTPVPARYDLTALSNNTVSYLIQSSGPAVLVPGDTFNALISQIRRAAETWNTVSTCAIKLSFGGLSPMTLPDSSPEVDVVFDDNMPPGLLAQTRLTTVEDIADPIANGATFIPVLNARVQLHNDLNANQQPSYSDAFFLTIVHEFGHSLGLQHTLTSSVMSTQITSSVTKSAPLAADDIAGISLLYPANGYPAGTGSITGAVAVLGAGVNMASVVALSTSGVAVSSLTNPDGSYQIAGIPPGQYYVYVHPLPPPALGEAYPDNIVPPQDTGGNQFGAFTTFGSQFYGGTTDWTQTSQISVVAGQSTDGINFQVQPRPSGPAIFGVSTYGYLGPGGQIPVGQPPLQSGTATNFVFIGNGVAANNKVAPGLNVSVIGGTAQVSPNSLTYYTSGYLLMVVDANAVSSYTPTALAMTVNGDLYVLPGAFSVVPSAVPTISSVNGSTDANGNSMATVAGTSLSANTKILFDGAPASLLQVNTDGSLLVAAPPASNGYHASVEALSPDSQTSGQLLGLNAPPAFLYAGPASPAISVNPGTVTAGTDTMVQITGYNSNFVNGTVIGLGSSDVTVNQVWVVSSSLLQMNISVSPTAQVESTTVSVASGLQFTTLSAALQIAAANPGQITLRTPILNQATGLAGVPTTGGTVLINTSGLPFTATSNTVAGWVLTIANQPVPFSVGSNGQLIAQVPVGLTTGPQQVQLTTANGVQTPPVLLQVDPPPPVITGVLNSAGVAIGPSNQANPGDTVTLLVTGLADAFGNYPAPSSIDINAAGVDVTPASLTPAGGSNCTLQVTLSPNAMTGAQTVTIRVGTRLSAAFPIQIQ